MFIKVLLLLFLYTSLAATQDLNQEPKRVRIGMLLTLSGGFATAGEDGRRGIKAGLAIAKADSKLQIVYVDSRNEPQTAISEFSRLVETEKVLAVYTHRAPIGMSLNPVSLRAQVPLLGCVGNQDFAAENKFAIQLWPRADEEGEFLAEEFIRLNYKQASLIYTEDDWTDSVSQGFRERFISRGGKLLLDQSVLPGETDFCPLLLRVKKSSPQAIFFNVLLPQIGLVLKQARELEIKSALFSNFYVTRKDVTETAGTTATEGVRYLEIDSNLPTLKSALAEKIRSHPQV